LIRACGAKGEIRIALLEVKNLKTHFFTEEGISKVVDGVDLVIEEGEILGMVGESGCGKSVTALSIMRLVSPPGRTVGGEILFNGVDLLKLNKEAARRIRGKDISMVFQEPMTSLNPVYTIGNQIEESIILHERVTRAEARERAKELLALVGIPEPANRLNEYPHHLSGGMRQRIVIAIALSCNPKLIIADEPTTALDVTIQAQILELMSSLRERLNSAILLITHDLGVIAEMAERVLVMYAGLVVEQAKVTDLFRRPLHPYTKGLMNSISKLVSENKRLEAIPGNVPNLLNMPPGCSFYPRCSYAQKNCQKGIPPLKEISPGHKVRCWMHEGGVA